MRGHEVRVIADPRHRLRAARGGGATAFLIAVDEYRKHQMAGWHLCKGALTAGGFAFGVFMLFSLTAGVWLET